MADEPIPDGHASPLGETDDPGFDNAEREAAARRWRAYQRDRTARLEVYTEAAKALLAARGFPVLPGNDTSLSASNQQNLDATIRRACKQTLLAILNDMKRIADSAASGDAEISP